MVVFAADETGVDVLVAHADRAKLFKVKVKKRSGKEMEKKGRRRREREENERREKWRRGGREVSNLEERFRRVMAASWV